EVLLRNGKKIRPYLVQMIATGLGVPDDQWKVCARCVEWAHAATLAHDDVIDESPLRRNRPTLNTVVGNTRAVLTGDILLSRVIGELSLLGQPRVLQEMALAVEQLVTGEWLQLDARWKFDVDPALLKKIAELKTGSLLAWACVAPGLLKGLDTSDLESLKNFGIQSGRAFQLVDDLIDFLPTGGKPFAQDLREGLVNQAALRMFAHDHEAERRLRAAFQEKHVSDRFLQFSELALSRTQIEIRAEAAFHLREASRSLQQLKPHFEPDSFKTLNEWLQKWETRIV
ncbi:MAG: polyprenyl synthetase family protein, partial [Proteobacteria bacterium]